MFIKPAFVLSFVQKDDAIYQCELNKERAALAALFYFTRFVFKRIVKKTRNLYRMNFQVGMTI